MQDFPDPQLPAETVTAFQTAFDNIHAFHNAQLRNALTVETMSGVTCRRVTRPIGKKQPEYIIHSCSVYVHEDCTLYCIQPSE